MNKILGKLLGKLYLGHLTLVGKALSFTMNFIFSFFFFFINQPCLAAAVQWTAIKMYYGDLVVGTAWYRDLAHPSLIFTVGQKV